MNEINALVQGAVGMQGLVLRLPRAVATHALIRHVAVGVVRIRVLFGSWRVSQRDGCCLPAKCGPSRGC